MLFSNRIGKLAIFGLSKLSQMDRKTVLISGATAGIGRATALRFGREQYNVIITGRRGELLAELESELKMLGCKVVALQFDVRKRLDVFSTVESLPADMKNIDILVNNAGLAVGLEHIDRGDTDDWERMIDTNIKGLLWLTRAVAPLMVERGSGHIINIASIAGKEVYENGNVYCATKFAVDALSKSMRIDLLANNIKVTNIAPGMVETEFSVVRFKGNLDKAATPYKGLKPLTGDDIADVIYYCATLPAHVNINDVTVMPTAQAAATIINRK
jgi:3-hydroxy acid dehydrogenase / malonic semialdehyde reductase